MASPATMCVVLALGGGRSAAGAVSAAAAAGAAGAGLSGASWAKAELATKVEHSVSPKLNKTRNRTSRLYLSTLRDASFLPQVAGQE